MDIEAYLKKDYITTLVKSNKRIDGRGFDQYRDIEITKGFVSEKSEGSALVKLGDTSVLVGVSIDIGEPYPDKPNEGVMITSAELRPMAAPTFESGPPREDAIELARVVDRGIRESGAIDLEKLFIEKDKVYVVFIDIHTLDHTGNLIDASGIASIAALLDTRLPKYEGGKIIRGEFIGKLPITCIPVPCTFAKIFDKVLIDPTLDEEYAMDSRLTITTTDTINALQKGGNGMLTFEDIQNAVDLSFKKADEIRKLVEK